MDSPQVWLSHCSDTKLESTMVSAFSLHGERRSSSKHVQSRGQLNAESHVQALVAVGFH